MFEEWLKNKTVTVIAPAGRVDAEALNKAADVWSSWGAAVKIMPHASGSETQFFAAPKELRAADINSAFADAESDFIICARGGYGCAELHDLIDWELLRTNPKIIIGYSDITALHMMMLKHQCGVPVAGAMFLKAPELFAKDTENCLSFMRAIDGNEAVFRTSDRNSFHGFCIVANLAVLSSLCGSELLPDFSAKCLILEDLNESPYKIHRMLTQLELCGIFNKISALGCGEFLDCGENPSEIYDMLRHFAEKHDIPCFFDLPIGHGERIHAVNMLQKIRIN